MKRPADASLPTRRTFLALAAGASAFPVFAGRGGFAQPPPDDPTGLSLTDVAGLVRSKKVSPVELTRACLGRIERLNPSLNAFITVTDVTALAQARAAEAEIVRGKWRGPLHGIPIALKDNIDTAGVRTTAASNVLSGRVPEQDAEVVIRLRAAGAVLLGKLNMHEFAYGGTSLVSHFGPVRNPWRKDYITGGSSGGSAAALAAGLCFGALGTDTGGIHPAARLVLRHRRAEAHLRARQPARRAAAGLVARSHRADGALGGRPGGDAPGDSRLRRSRCHECR